MKETAVVRYVGYASAQRSMFCPFEEKFDILENVDTGERYRYYGHVFERYMATEIAELKAMGIIEQKSINLSMNGRIYPIEFRRSKHSIGFIKIHNEWR